MRTRREFIGMIFHCLFNNIEAKMSSNEDNERLEDFSLYELILSSYATMNSYIFNNYIYNGTYNFHRLQ